MSENKISLEDISKIGFLGFSFLYILGFIVTCLYLDGIGVSNVTFIESQYVLTGAFAFMPIVILISMTYGVILIMRLFWIPYKVQHNRNKFIQMGWAIFRGINFLFSVTFLTLLVFSIPIYNFLTFNSDSIAKVFNFSFANFLVVIAIFYFVLIGIGGLLFRRCIYGQNIADFKKFNIDKEDRIITESENIVLNNAFFVFLISIWLVFFSAYIKSYSQYIFPLIPQALAGGKSTIIRIVKKKDVNFPENILMSDKDTVSRKCKLLFETSDKLILVSDTSSNQPIIIYKDNILAILLTPDTPIKKSKK